LKDPGVDGKIILSWIYKKWDMGAWTGSSWLRIGTDDDRHKCGNEPYIFMKCGDISWQAEELIAYQEGPCSMGLFRFSFIKIVLTFAVHRLCTSFMILRYQTVCCRHLPAWKYILHEVSMEKFSSF
jgi:hypothetical protein